MFFDEVIEGASRAKALGFPSLGLEIYCDEQYAAYTPQSIRAIRDHFQQLGLESTAFLACAPRAKLASITPEVRRAGLADFQRIVDIVSALGVTDIISLVSSAPPEAVTSYLQTYPGAPPASMVLPPSTSWQEVWSTYIDTVGTCLAMATSRGLRLAIEPLPMSVVSTTDSYLRLAEAIGSSSLGILIDTSHLFYQRESLPVTVEKVQGHIFGFCACDNDGVQDFHWAPGKGRIPWTEVLTALKRVGYNGSIDLEINVAESPDSAYTEARSYLQEILDHI